jgi:hypothetical protein
MNMRLHSTQYTIGLPLYNFLKKKSTLAMMLMCTMVQVTYAQIPSHNTTLDKVASTLVQADHTLSVIELASLYNAGAIKIVSKQNYAYQIWYKPGALIATQNKFAQRQVASDSKLDPRLAYLGQSVNKKEIELLVSLCTEEFARAAKNELSQIIPSAQVVDAPTIGASNIIVRLSSEDVHVLQQIAAVQYISPLPPKDVPLNNVGQAQMNTALVAASAAIGGSNLAGDSIVVGIGDDADLQSHVDFRDRLFNFNAAPLNSHGSIVAGQCAGRGMIQPRYKGVLPNATIVSSLFSNIQSYTPKFYSDYHMTLTNNSYGTVLFDCNNHGIYDALSKALDEQALALPLVTHVFAGGNDGLVQCSGRPQGMYSIFGQYQVAKNIIVVGNVQNNDTIFNESSKGPTLYDKRLRPDVVALGVAVQSCGANDTYTPGWGSSMSSPFTAGVVGLLQQRYKQVYGQDIRSDLAKAAIMNGATDIGIKGPDFTYGYGRVNALRSVRMLESGNFRLDSVANGDSVQVGYTIANPNIMLKAMLYYHDVPGEPNIYPSLINNLDLTLTSPSGVNYKPFLLDGTDTFTIFMPATTGRDSLNNAEQIEVGYPALGLWQFTIKGKKVVNGKQHFVLVIDTIPVGLHLRYPVGNHHLISNTSTKEPIMWDIYDTSNYAVNLQFSGNSGNTWNTIASNLPATTRQYFWNATACDSSGILIRVVGANGQTITSQRSSSMAIPVVTVGPATEQCPSYCRISWTSVAGATGYYIYKNQGNTMVLVDSTINTLTNYLFRNLGTTQKHYFAVRARKYHLLSEQSNARSYIANAGNCSLNQYNFDLQAKAVISKTAGRANTSSAFSNSDTVKIQFANVDNVKCDSFILGYQINNDPWVILAPRYDFLQQSTQLLLLTNLNLNIPGNYTIKAAIKNIAKVDPNSTNDTISFVVRSLSNDTLNLTTMPYSDGFETVVDTNIKNTVGLEGDTRWDISHTSLNGRARSFVMKNFAATGQRAITLESSVYNAAGTTNYFDGTFNLSNENATTSDIRLSLRYKHHGQDTTGGNNNAIYVRGSDSLPWIKIYDLLANQDQKKGVYKEVVALDFAHTLKKVNQSLSSSTQIRITQSGRFKTGDDETLSGYTLDDVSVFKVYNDLSLTKIAAPKMNVCAPGATANITVDVKNSASTPIANATAAYQIDNGSWITEVIPVIPADTTISYTFNTKANLSIPKIYLINSYVHSSSDSYNLNDSALRQTINAFSEISTYPYVETFENSDGNFISTGINSSWQYGSPATSKVPKAASGTKAWKTSINGKYNDNELSYLISPCFNLGTLQQPWLSWHMSYDIEDCNTALCDAAWIELSTNGIEWAKVVPDTTLAPNQYLGYYNDSTWQIWKNTASAWKSYSIPLPKNSGNVLQFRFVLNTDAGVTFDGIAVDDIHVYDNAATIPTSSPALSNYTQNVGGNAYTPIVNGQQLYISLNPQGATMGNVKTTTYHNTGALRTVNNKYFLDRNYVIQPEIANYATPVQTRLYFADADVARVLEDTTCANCTKPSNVFDLEVLKYSSIQRDIEDSTLANNTVGGYTNYDATDFYKIPMKDGHFVEIPVKTFSEFWLHFGADTTTESTFVPNILLTADNAGALSSLINWTLPKELNIHHHDVLRAEGNNPTSTQFNQVATLVSKGDGNNNNYATTDNVPVGNTVYMYRIRTVSNTGDEFYSDMRPVVFGSAQTWSVYPNPISAQASFLQFQLPKGSTIAISIYDMQGKRVMQQSYTATGNIDKIQLGTALATGIYNIEVVNSERTETFRVIKQ